MNMSTESNKGSKYTHLWHFLSFAIILASTWSLHADNKKQIEKMANLINKYEVQLDAAIAQDPTAHVRYAKNLRNALKELSPQEREILLAIYEIDKK
jgi:hypothetical protein